MSKLYFRYGAMNCGKTTALLQVAHNYEEKNLKVIIVKSKVDTKGEDKIVSRLGVERKVDVILNQDEILTLKYDLSDISCILVDEAQFLNNKQIEDLWKITKLKNIPVICYGLKVDFTSHLFEGSKRLIELADVLEELITICSCGKRAKFNARKINNKYTLTGKEVMIDTVDDCTYEPLCGKCYIEKVLKEDKYENK